jgi:ATP-dependent Clp protease adaptor protein ClpS
MAGTDIQLEDKIKEKVKQPNLWKVILINDDLTPIDFVISLLIEVFKHDVDSAKTITFQVHEQGSGIAGTYSHEIAETKANEAIKLSRSNGFPLQIKIEEE